MLQDSSSNQTSPHVLTNQTFEGDRREAVRHIIIGSPLGVRRTIHQLHALRYEEAVRWTHPIAIPDDRIIRKGWECGNERVFRPERKHDTGEFIPLEILVY